MIFYNNVRQFIFTDTTTATNVVFETPITYNEKDSNENIIYYDKDSVEYRKAKFKYEYENYFIKDSLLGIPYPDDNVKEGMLQVTNSVTAYAPSFYGIMDDNYTFINTVKMLNPTKKYTFEHINMTSARFAYAYPE